MSAAERLALLELLQKHLDYTFTNVHWLDLALTHRSYVHETAATGGDYERLEFLGDAVLGLLVGSYLYTRYPQYHEGQLSQLRAQVVSTKSLADLGRQIDLGRFLRLGRGEERAGGRNKNSLLAAAFEAVMGAIYFDGGLQKVQTIFLRLFASTIEQWTAAESGENYKGTLQQLTLQIFGCLPTYRTILEEGPAHYKTFHVQLTLPHDYGCIGVGRSKKAAEQHAAQQLLALLSQSAERPCV